MIRIPFVTEVVRGDVARFVRLDDENLWYSVDYTSDEGVRVSDWQFPIARRETAGAVFHATEKPILLMRWIRRWIIVLRRGNKE